MIHIHKAYNVYLISVFFYEENLVSLIFFGINFVLSKTDSPPGSESQTQSQCLGAGSSADGSGLRTRPGQKHTSSGLH